jgi:archaellin
VKYGNSKSFFITLTNSAGSAIDLTDATILFTVKKTNEIEQETDTDETALLTKTITDITPLEGKFTISISPEDTKTIGF